MLPEVSPRMATMFPTPLPAAVATDPGRDAERRVYDTLARLLDPEHAVFYSVAWLTRATGPAARDGEADFVIAHSDLGVLVLEVKGGQIGHDQMSGEWHSTDRRDHRHAIRDPFAQATSSHHALEAKLMEHPVIRRFYVRIGHGVVFPDSANPHRPLMPNAEPAITVFAEDLDHIDACVRRMFDYWAGSMGRALAPAPGFVQAVTDLLAPRFELPRSLGATIKGDDRELLRLTEDQFRVLDMLSRQRRVAVSGGAGTGKTMLALEKARRLAAEGLEVLLTCYNRPLANYLRQAAGPCERLTIANYHTLCWDMAKAAGNPFPDTSVADPPPGFYERILPEALLAALDTLPRRFDAIVVDEGQDFLDTWWDPAHALAGRSRRRHPLRLPRRQPEALPPHQRVPGGHAGDPSSRQSAQHAPDQRVDGEVLPGPAHARARPRRPGRRAHRHPRRVGDRAAGEPRAPPPDQGQRRRARGHRGADGLGTRVPAAEGPAHRRLRDHRGPGGRALEGACSRRSGASKGSSGKW